MKEQLTHQQGRGRDLKRETKKTFCPGSWRLHWTYLPLHFHDQELHGKCHIVSRPPSVPQGQVN